MRKSEWPRTVEDAARRVLDELPPEELDVLAGMARRDLLEAHRGLGMGIRNGFGLWQGNEELLADCAGGSRWHHPDDASAVIIERAWERLRLERGEVALHAVVGSAPAGDESSRLLAELVCDPARPAPLREAALARLSGAPLDVALEVVLDPERWGGDDAELRRRALERLLERAPSRSHAQILRVLIHPEAVVSERCARALAHSEIPVVELVPALVAASRHRDVDWRVYGVIDALLPPWRDAVQAGSVPARTVAALAGYLRPRCDDGYRDLPPECAVRALIAAEPHPDIVPTLCELYPYRDDLVFRYLSGLSPIPTLLLERVAEQAARGHEKAIAHAARLRPRFGAPMRNALVAALGSPTLRIRLAAALSLMVGGAGSELGQCLRIVAEALHHDVQHRDQAGSYWSDWAHVDAPRLCSHLSRHGWAAQGAGILDALRSALASSRWEVRLAAAAALWRLGAPAAAMLAVVEGALGRAPAPERSDLARHHPACVALRVLAPLGLHARPVLPWFVATLGPLAPATSGSRGLAARLLRAAERVTGREAPMPDGPAREVARS